MISFAAQQTAARVAAARRLGTAQRRRRVPRPQYPKLIQSDYAGRLVGLLAGMRAAFERALPSLVTDLPRDQRRDEDVAVRARTALDQAREEVEAGINTTQLEGLAAETARRVADHQRRDLERQARAALGTDVIIMDQRLGGVIAGFVRENVALIKKLKNGSLDDLESMVARAYASGTRAEDLAAEITARFGTAERHARLIARDQIGKLIGQVARARHQELGIRSYEWQSLRVGNRRQHHVARHGKRFRYDTPPADGHPGTAICCACLAKPVFDDVYAELAALGV